MRKLIVALDVPTVEEAWDVWDDLEGLEVSWKVGLHLAVAVGAAELIRDLGERGGVMLDLKMNDIPTTMKAGVRRAGELGAEFVTLGAGVDAGQVRVAQRGQIGDRPELLGVTMLTSSTATAIGVAARADALMQMGVNGVVCSGVEAAEVRSICGPDLRIVCPGIRPKGWVVGDGQKRVCSAEEAVLGSADHLVVGRPIVTALKRRAAAEEVLAEIVRAEFVGGGLVGATVRRLFMNVEEAGLMGEACWRFDKRECPYTRGNLVDAWRDGWRRAAAADLAAPEDPAEEADA